MDNKRTNIDSLLDRATEAIRETPIDTATVDAAAARVRLQIAEPAVETAARPVSRIEGCADFQALMTDYLKGSLTEARRLLLEDHTHECLPCRKALKAARTGETPAATYYRPMKSKVATRPRFTTPVRWAIAAGLVAAFGVLPVARYLNPFGSFETVVEAADGPVYAVEHTATWQLGEGATIESGQRVRTARDAGAVLRLEDGTRIELRERSELAVTHTGRGTTIRLDRGSIIVDAVRDASHRVYVKTPSALIDVAASTVSVASGTKGTRVSTVDGRARVESAGVEHEIGAGDQFATSATIDPVPVVREVAWSRNADKYAQVLAEVAALRKEIDQKFLTTESRTSTRLLDVTPAGTVFYVALPNISASLADANRLMQERIRQNPALAAWWAEQRGAENRAGIDRAIETLRDLGANIGPELVVAVLRDASGAPGSPVVLAEVTDPVAFRAALERQIANVPAGHNHDVRIVDDPATIGTDDKSLSIVIRDGLVMASPSGDVLRSVAAFSGNPEANPFRATTFHAKLAAEYGVGVAFLVAADLKPIVGEAVKKDQKLEGLGLSDVEYFIVRQSMDGERSNARAVLTFDEQRRGIASWLAAPGPMGALEYISPDANVVAAFVVKEPSAVVDDMIGFLGTADPEALVALRKFEAENGVNLRNDFAAPMGGEFAFAIDGPVLPTPSWKMIFEVNDPTRLQGSFEHAVEAINRKLAAEGKPGLALSRTDADGRTYHAIASTTGKGEVHYAFVDGYMIAAPSRALIERAIRYRESGVTIRSSTRFMSALPADGNTNFSAIMYQDLAPMLAGVAGSLPLKSMDAETRQTIDAIASGVPTVAYAYAHADRIEFAATGQGLPFGLSPSTLLGLPASTGLLGKALGMK